MKRILMLTSLLTLVAFSAFATMTRYPNGLTVGTEEQEATANLTVGAGNEYVAGTLEVDGATRLDGAVSVNNSVEITGYTVNIASAATSSEKLYFAGVFASLPTTGYSKNTICALTNSTVYISTEAVAGAFSWVKIGAQ